MCTGGVAEPSEWAETWQKLSCAKGDRSQARPELGAMCSAESPSRPARSGLAGHHLVVVVYLHLRDCTSFVHFSWDGLRAAKGNYEAVQVDLTGPPLFPASPELQQAVL